MILSICIIPHQSVVLPLFILLQKSLCGVQVGIKYVAHLPCIFCKVKPWIQGEKCHILRSRCACVWNIWWLSVDAGPTGYPARERRSSSTRILLM